MRSRINLRDAMSVCFIRNLFWSLGAAVLLGGCAVFGSDSMYQEAPAQEADIQMIDFSEYYQNGFLMTPGAYTGRYQPIGLISAAIWPQTEKTKEQSSEQAQQGILRVNLEEALDRVYQEARDQKADGLTHLEIRTITRTLEGGQELQGAEIRGFLIDRD